VQAPAALTSSQRAQTRSSILSCQNGQNEITVKPLECFALNVHQMKVEVISDISFNLAACAVCTFSIHGEYLMVFQ